MYKLVSQNFALAEANGAKELRITLHNPTFVMIKMQGCNVCKITEPIVVQLSNEHLGLDFGILDITNDRTVVNSSRGTRTPITKVPQFILYCNGRPFAKFNDKDEQKRDYNTIKNFIVDAMNTYNSRMASQQQIQHNSFVQPPQQQNMYGGYTQPDNKQHPSLTKHCDPDDDDCLKMPSDVIPHNTPWEVDIRKITY